MTADDDLASVAAELYALAPEDFTAARDAAAKAADGALRTAVKALRRPTASAWLVNRLAREQPALLDQLLGLGPALAHAQAVGSGDDLRALGRQRRELVQAVTTTAVGGSDVSAAVRSEVEHTLEAALADPSAAEAVRSGTLVRALSFAGFGGVDVEGAVAVARPAGETTRGAGTGRPRGTTTKRDVDKAPGKKAASRVATAEQAALDAAAALDDAVQACRAAEDRQAAADQALERAQQARDEQQRVVDDLEAQLSQARERLEAEGHRAHDARQERDKAARTADRAAGRVAEAQQAADQARAALDELRRS